MHDSGVGRLLVASLHQSIVEELPFRLDFYESWFNPVGLREGRIGLAPLTAVLSFLRQENGDAYTRCTARAGRYSADWYYDALSPARRRLLHWLPRRLRVWQVTRLSRELVGQTYGGSRLVTRGVGWGRGVLDLRASVFCQVRAHVPHPLCEYYASAVDRLFELCRVEMGARPTSCRAMGADRCLLTLSSHLDRAER
jgi:hypothetical protein